ncbi:MAG: AzlC family ABC transporter permease [Lachnospiraceae bacterium]|nr:AzlC family ABC transporter permease [Lachnospiraceae bacterium]
MNQIVSNSHKNNGNRQWFQKGLRNGIPICMGYFAVSFALGIAARNVGMDALQAGIMSVGMVASAGEFAAINLIGASAGALEMIFTTIVVNMRYLLMSTALSQKLKEKTPFYHRLFLSYCMTDEIFGLSVTVDGYLNPFYTYGITVVSVLGWTLGTVLGVLMGNILPSWAVNALSVALYGMFLAIIIPPIKKNRFIGLLVVISMAASFAFAYLPVLCRITSGFRVIILTLVIAGIAAWVHPVRQDQEEKKEAVQEDN